MNPRILISSGVEYQHADLNLRDESLMFPLDVINGMWVRGRSYYEVNYTYQFIGVPISGIVLLGPIEKKNHFFVEGGLKIRKKISTSGEEQLTESGFQHPGGKIDEVLFPDTPNA